MRIDKWLWAVRIFKSRSMASDACKKGEITLNGQSTKSSREVKEGDMIVLERNYHRIEFKVLGFPASRVSAKLTPQFVEKISQEENEPDD